MKHGKKYIQSKQKTAEKPMYSLEEAVKKLKETNLAKFVETVDVAIRLNIDTKKSDQSIRTSIKLPHGTGKQVRVLVFAKGDKLKEAVTAGADYAGSDELFEKISKTGWCDFDVAIATPDIMKEVGKLGKILGQKGLMPNPKAQTVTFDVSKAVKDFKTGKIEVRNDNTGNVHAIIGKVSFEVPQLIGNCKALIDEVQRLRPVSVKGQFIKNISISSTMGPSLKLNVSEFLSQD